jgi:hypothetical protein
VQAVAPAAQGLDGEDDGTADEEVLGILQRRSGHGDHRAAEFVVVGVAAVVDTHDLAGEMVAQGVERRGEAAADVEEDDLAASGAFFEVAQGPVEVARGPVGVAGVAVAFDLA